MDTRQIELVQASFELVRPMANQAAEIFYRRLFEIAPHYRSLLKHDMKKQGATLMSTLGLAVGSLNNLEASLPAVRSLGQRHAGYGITAEHYQPVAEAFLLHLYCSGVNLEGNPTVIRAVEWRADECEGTSPRDSSNIRSRRNMTNGIRIHEECNFQD